MQQLTVVIFEPYITGHRREYLNHLMEYLGENEVAHSFVFVVNPEFEELSSQSSVFRNQQSQQVGTSTALKPAIRNPKLVTHKIIRSEFQILYHRNIVTRSFRYFRLAKKFAQEYEADHFLFLSLNDVQLALGLLKFPCSASGILFKPFYRIGKKSVKDLMIWIRKYFQTWLFVRKERIDSVFILNDKKAVDYLNRCYRVNKFEMLPDPVPNWTADPDFHVKEYYGIEAKRKILLHAGSFSIRKGTLEILESLQYLAKEELKQIALVLVGEPESGMDEIILIKLEQVRLEYPDVLIIDQLDFVPDKTLQAYLEQCDALLIPYHSHESSSGLVGHAIVLGKHIICVEKGLLGEMIQADGRGILLEGNSPKDISQGIKELLKRDMKPIKNTTFRDAHNPENFARQILNNLVTC